jgi:hypothetical protein
MEITSTANYTVFTDEPLLLDTTQLYNGGRFDHLYSYINSTGEYYAA